MDESHFESSYGTTCRIVEYISLGGGRHMIGTQALLSEEDEPWEFSENIEYYMLDEVRMKLLKPNRDSEEE